MVGDSPRLSALTAKTLGKALQLMAEKAEYMTYAGMSHHACCSFSFTYLRSIYMYMSSYVVKYIRNPSRLTIRQICVLPH